MKYSVAIYLLISNASFATAMRLNVGFMPDIKDDDTLVKEVSRVTSISSEDEEMVEKVVEKEQKDLEMKQKMMQVHS